MHVSLRLTLINTSDPRQTGRQQNLEIVNDGRQEDTTRQKARSKFKSSRPEKNLNSEAVERLKGVWRWLLAPVAMRQRLNGPGLEQLDLQRDRLRDFPKPMVKARSCVKNEL